MSDPVTGLYWSGLDHEGKPISDGQGLALFADSQRYQGFYYGFDEAGNPRYWLWGALKGQNNGSLVTTSGGTFDEPTKALVAPESENDIAAVRPVDKYHILWQYNSQRWGRGAWELEALAAEFHDCGIYYDPAKNGSGFTVFHAGDTCYCYWYTYKDADKDHMGRPIEGTTQAWYLATGKNELQVLRPFGQTWRGFKEVQYEHCGTATFTPQKFTYDTDMGSGQYELARLM